MIEFKRQQIIDALNEGNFHVLRDAAETAFKENGGVRIISFSETVELYNLLAFNKWMNQQFPD